MQTLFDVVVVGGGVAGCATALGLAQTGARVAHVSVDSTVPVLGQDFDARIYALSATSVALLKRLRVWDALDASRMCAVTDMRISGDSSEPSKNAPQQGSLHFNAYSAHLPELAWIVEQKNIQNALQMALRFVPNLSTFKSTASALVVDEQGVRITCENGETVAAPLLIGADGAGSWVRQAHGIDIDVFDYEQDGVVANFSCEKPHHGCAHQWFFDNGDVLALLPLPGDNVSMVYSCAKAISNELMALEGGDIEQRMTTLSNEQLGTLKLHSSTLPVAHAFPLKRRRATRMIAPHTLLMGDAAHTVHPLAGQGLNLGLQDLSDWLDICANKEPHRAINDTVLLRRYERSRAVPTAQMQQVTHALNRVFQHPHPLIKQARNLGMNMLDVMSPLKRKLIQTALGRKT